MGLGFRVLGLRFRVRLVGVSGAGLSRLGFWVRGSGFRVQGSGFMVQGSGFRVQGAQGSGFRVWGLGCSLGCLLQCRVLVLYSAVGV